MPNFCDRDDHQNIFDMVNDSEISNSDSPKIIEARHFRASSRAGIIGKGLDFCPHFFTIDFGKPQEFSLCRREEFDPVFHAIPARFLTCFQLIRFSRGFFSRRSDSMTSIASSSPNISALRLNRSNSLRDRTTYSCLPIFRFETVTSSPLLNADY